MSFNTPTRWFFALSLAALAACAPPAAPPGAPASEDATAALTTGRPDPHSYANADEVRVTHLALDLAVDFTARTLAGRASLTIDNLGGAEQIHLDTRDLTITAVTLDDGKATAFELKPAAGFLGSELVVDVTPETSVVHVDYVSDPGAGALQWLAPELTAGGEHPYLLSQSQSILARTWVPCQDTPAVRFTYEATLRVPPTLMALMSAENPTEKTADGVYHFSMPQPIPSYLLAIAVGDLEFRALDKRPPGGNEGGRRSRAGVYAEPAVVDQAAWEFAETEAMLAAVEKLYGPYRWGRYDILVLPPSFPFGGMENPRLTFVSPTLIAGDRSLVSTIAHEIAHSWSGNLVTNATWNDFWLNEGFTTYLENRIMEELNGRDDADMLAFLEISGFHEEIAGMPPADTHLRLDLAGRDADDGATGVPYVKGSLFLHLLERTMGRDAFDPFLRAWFDGNAFHSRTTDDFLAYLNENVDTSGLHLDAWIDGPGLPENAPTFTSEAFTKVEAAASAWQNGKAAAELDTDGWTTQEWLRFLAVLPPAMTAEQMGELDAAFGFTSSHNAEIAYAWLRHAIANKYEAADGALEEFLVRVGRRKFVDPLYRALAATDSTKMGRERAREIYAKARAGYHPVVVAGIDELLDDA